MAIDRQRSKNYWSSYKNPAWVWEIVFSYAQIAPERLAWWAGEALEALYETGIYKVFSVPELGYLSPTAQPRRLADMIRERLDREGIVELLYFSKFADGGHPDYDIATALTYYGDSGNLVTEDCKDLAALQMKTQPWLNELEDFVYHRKAFVISGARYAAKNPASHPGENMSLKNKEVRLRIQTYSDIWLPKVQGWNEPGWDGDRRLANDELAAQNGTRLNEAIRRLRAITASVGGIWRIDEEFAGRKGEFDEAGVVM
jgi:hypothetical protein